MASACEIPMGLAVMLAPLELAFDLGRNTMPVSEPGPHEPGSLAPIHLAIAPIGVKRAFSSDIRESCRNPITNNGRGFEEN